VVSELFVFDFILLGHHIRASPILVTVRRIQVLSIVVALNN